MGGGETDRNRQCQAMINVLVKHKARYEAEALEEVTLGNNTNEVRV